YTIRGYLKDIRDNCHKLSICLDWNSDSTESKIQTIFFCGLHEKTRFEISKHDKRDFTSIFNILINMETFIIENECNRNHLFYKDNQQNETEMGPNKYNNNYHKKQHNNTRRKINAANYIRQFPIVMKSVVNNKK
ncbi:hypothetical protein DMUE_6091, partial [Dictyocoela muelleri]